jgi:charged multivesicular body protein 7
MAPASASPSRLRSYIPSAGSVASALLVSPARWAVSLLGLLATSADDFDSEYGEDERLFRLKTGDWVVYENVHRIATGFLADHFEKTSLSPLSSLMSVADFRARLVRVCQARFRMVPSERDVEIVLKHLVRDCGGVVVAEGGVVKLAPSEAEAVGRLKEEDKGVVAVQTTLGRVEVQVAELERRMAERKERARAALRAGQRGQAASCLQGRRALEALLARRLATQETLAAVLVKIEQAQTDVEIMRTYQTANAVLASVLARDELAPAHIDRTLGQLEQSLASQQEIDDAIRSVGTPAIDDAQIAAELQSLLDDKLDHDLAARLDNLRLPSPPDATPQQPASSQKPSPLAAAAQPPSPLPAPEPAL